MKSEQLILITGVERSGSTLISRVLQMCGANAGQTNKMCENTFLRSLSLNIIQPLILACEMPDYLDLKEITNWKELVETELGKQETPFMYKDSQITQLWTLWHEAYKDAKWIIVRRRTGDILNSLHETAYMTRFKIIANQMQIGALNEKEGWLWWVHEYERHFVDMIEAGVNHKIVWAERMRDGDFDQMKEVVDWCGLSWNEEVEDVMKTLLKSKK